MAQIVCESLERQLRVAIACNHGEQFVLAGAINEDGANVLVASGCKKGHTEVATEWILS